MAFLFLLCLSISLKGWSTILSLIEIIFFNFEVFQSTESLEKHIALRYVTHLSLSVKPGQVRVYQNYQ